MGDIESNDVGSLEIAVRVSRQRPSNGFDMTVGPLKRKFQNALMIAGGAAVTTALGVLSLYQQKSSQFLDDEGDQNEIQPRKFQKYDYKSTRPHVVINNSKMARKKSRKGSKMRRKYRKTYKRRRY